MSLQNIYKFFLVDAQSGEIFNCITFQPLGQESLTSKFVLFSLHYQIQLLLIKFGQDWDGSLYRTLDENRKQ